MNPLRLGHQSAPETAAGSTPGGFCNGVVAVTFGAVSGQICGGVARSTEKIR
ncbi:hypothetical protein [Arthrobacter sp. DR-2P]|nr:hypothetical protein [Arthrobacter sp. DR-2P]